MTERDLEKRIAELEAELEPLRVEQRKIWRDRELEIDARIYKAERGCGDFQLHELRFSAIARCSCGAGLCYPLNIGMRGSWYCSDILRGGALPKGNEGAKPHSDRLPFVFYEVKSENQPSANGMTTRPTE